MPLTGCRTCGLGQPPPPPPPPPLPPIPPWLWNPPAPQTIILRERDFDYDSGCPWWKEPKEGPDGDVYCGVSVPIVIAGAGLAALLVMGFMAVRK